MRRLNLDSETNFCFPEKNLLEMVMLTCSCDFFSPGTLSETQGYMKSESLKEVLLLSPVYLLLHGLSHNFFGFNLITENVCDNF